ncbi:MAG: addiction module protein [Deltaproteobacteria bacterium]|nr:addiction module protein [Deltaproteobacteria bacterium]
MTKQHYSPISKTTDDILNNAVQLSTTDRAELAAALLASLDGESEDAVEAAWVAEIQRRVERVRTLTVVRPETVRNRTKPKTPTPRVGLH